ncbi:sialidase family protein [Coraliomargarita sp. SDUM461004]|uniref:Sialidase family protein n=1 Tax=Thalassobacterium sedimentorum TaxID=3041258 RepID=A0ABU1AGW1_9BACT|nr:sialidase family protein [Coraliomargarita sp. SDUM461004]MDQ8194060.1 sialidase family protein [Coraliomargarita sp. SDUM461004]
MSQNLEFQQKPTTFITPPPGVVINHKYVKDGHYVGSPSIAKLKDGVYVASHDLFGPKTKEHEHATTLVFRSENAGKTWTQVATIDPAFWSGLFVHKGALYLMGTTHHHGLIAIRRSDDGGYTWTQPENAHSGLITPYGQYHTAPTALTIHNGRIWRAMEDATASTVWGERYNPIMLSAPLDADLLRRDSWSLTPVLRHSKEWLDGHFSAWLEGNAVVLPDGRLGNILRVDRKISNTAAIVTLSEDGKALEFDPNNDFIDFAGGATKFSIRKDDQSGLYWTLSNAVPSIHEVCDKQTFQRNALALMVSKDARHWEIRYVALYHPDPSYHGFQYVDWLFEEDDIIVASRTAWDDDQGGAENQHDANYLTFHRIQNFRELTIDDSPNNPF